MCTWIIEGFCTPPQNYWRGPEGAIHWLTQYTATCGRGEKIVRVHERFKAKKL